MCRSSGHHVDRGFASRSKPPHCTSSTRLQDPAGSTAGREPERAAGLLPAHVKRLKAAQGTRRHRRLGASGHDRPSCSEPRAACWLDLDASPRGASLREVHQGEASSSDPLRPGRASTRCLHAAPRRCSEGRVAAHGGAQHLASFHPSERKSTQPSYRELTIMALFPRPRLREALELIARALLGRALKPKFLVLKNSTAAARSGRRSRNRLSHGAVPREGLSITPQTSSSS